jgi:arylsulfatase A
MQIPVRIRPGSGRDSHQFDRIDALKIVLLLGCLLNIRGTTLFAAEANSPPNIVLIMADDFGYECVAANGGTSYQTPRLDELARTGMRFENCHVQPLCTPTRVQLMTGQYNDRNYLRFGILDWNAITFANLLRDAGYKTGVAGKWQLLGEYAGPGHFGFDEYWLWQLNRRPSRYANPGFENNGERVDFTTGEYGPDVINRHALEFVSRHQNEPFFLYYPMMLTHGPFDPTPDSPDWDPNGTEGSGSKGQPKDVQQRHFADMVAYMDKLAGRLIDHLETLKLRERTLVIFLGDNGTGKGIVSQIGDRVVHGGKGTTLDTGTHVPLIVNWPGRVSAGVVSQDLIDSTDFLPTLLEVAGVATPSNLPFDGRSFAPQLRGESGQPREWIYCWYEREGRPKQASVHVRDQQYKLYRDGRFFDVIADPDEEHALDAATLSTAAKEKREKFQHVLDDRAAAVIPINAR